MKILKNQDYSIDGTISDLIVTKVSYNVHGQDYEIDSKYYNKSMNVGDEIEVLYDVNNPQNAIINSKMIFLYPFITGILSIAALLAFGIYFIFA